MEKSIAQMEAREEAVADGECVAVAPALQAAGIVAGVVQNASEDAVLDDQGRRRAVPHQAADVSLAAACGVVDGGLDDAVADGGGASCTDESHQTGRMARACHFARHGEFPEGGSLHIAEGGSALRLCVTDVDIERPAVAVEVAGEGMCLGAPDGCDGRCAVVPVVGKLEILVGIGAVVDVESE